MLLYNMYVLILTDNGATLLNTILSACLSPFASLNFAFATYLLQGDMGTNLFALSWNMRDLPPSDLLSDQHYNYDCNIANQLLQFVSFTLKIFICNVI